MMAKARTSASTCKENFTKNNTRPLRGFCRFLLIIVSKCWLVCPNEMESTTLVNSIPVIPDDVIEEILYLLPLKSLLRFRCVSKAWNSLICSKPFCEIHLLHSQKTTSNTNVILLSANGYLRSCSFGNLLRKRSVKALSIDCLDSDVSKKLVGSCDGLVCLHENQKLFLLNPSTKKCIKLPRIPDLSYRDVHLKYAFGFDRSKDDYKVVSFCFRIHYILVNIYSIRTGKWRRAEDYSGYDWFGKLNLSKYANGKIHWLRYNRINDWEISYFDLETERYGMIEMPTPIRCCSNVNLDVCEGGDIYVLCDYNNYGEMWCLNGCVSSGGEQTWTNLATIPYAHVVAGRAIHDLYVVNNDGDILVMCGTQIMVFNIKDCSIRRRKFLFFNDDVVAAMTYVPSFISPWKR